MKIHLCKKRKYMTLFKLFVNRCKINGFFIKQPNIFFLLYKQIKKMIKNDVIG